MRRRLYFLLPGVLAAQQTANDLLLAHVEWRHMHVLARSGTDLGDLHEASALQQSDLVHGAQRGIVVGGLCGLVLGVVVLLTPPEGVALHLATVLATGLGGALLGAWIGSLVGAAIPNSRLAAFERDIEAGRVLLMVDVPFARVEEVREVVHRRHPEASDRGVEPAMPAFP
jgi:hypothetical protein